MKRDFLKELELTDEIIEKIMAEHGKTVNGLNQKIEEKDEEIRLTNEKVTALETQNKDTEKLLKSNEELLKNNDELKKNYEALQNTSKEQIEKIEKDKVNILKKSLVKENLVGAGAKHIDLLMHKINLDDVKIDNEKLFGFDEQLTNIKTNYADLFTTTEKQQNTNVGENNDPKGSGEMDFSFMDNL